jgi:hypothetical protein
MVVYDVENNCLRIYNGTKWARIGEQSEIVPFLLPTNQTTQTANGSITPTSVATGCCR